MDEGKNKTYTIEDVRKCLIDAYRQVADSQGIEGKSAEAVTALFYKPYWECETEEDIVQPCRLEIYSYALGPSRNHYFIKDHVYSRPKHYEWRGQDIYKMAIEAITEWKSETLNRSPE